MSDRKLNIKAMMDGDQAQKELKELESGAKKATKATNDLSGAKGSFNKQSAGFAKSTGGMVLGFNKLTLGIGAAYLAMSKLTEFGKSVIASAQEQETAVNDLNVALEASGRYSAETSRQLQSFATDLQKVTVYGDEATMAVIAQGANLTKLATNELPNFARAAVQVAELYGLSFEKSGLMIAKTLSSSTNALSRYGVQIDVNASQQDKLNQLLEATSAGMAKAEGTTNTSAGAWQQLVNAWGDTKEILGGVIIGGEGVSGMLGGVTDSLFALNDALTGNDSEFAKWSQSANETMSAVFAGIAEFMEPLAAWFKENMPLISDTFKASMDLMKQLWDTFGPYISEAWEATWAAVELVFSTVWNVITTLFEVSMATISGTMKTATALMQGDWSGAWEAIKETGERVWGSISSFFVDQFGIFREFFGKLWADIQADIDSAWSAIVDRLRSWKESVLNVFRNLEDEAVGNSIIPDMNRAIEADFDRMFDYTLLGAQLWAGQMQSAIAGVGGAAGMASAAAAIGAGGANAVMPTNTQAKDDADWNSFLNVAHSRQAEIIAQREGRGTSSASKCGPGGCGTGGGSGGGFGGGGGATAGRQFDPMGPLFGLLQQGLGNINGEGGFGGGIRQGLGGALSQLASGFLPGPLGGLVGSLVGGLFKKKQKQPTRAEAIPVKVINFSDMQSSLLNTTKQSLLGAGSGNVTRLNGLRTASAAVGI